MVSVPMGLKLKAQQVIRVASGRAGRDIKQVGLETQRSSDEAVPMGFPSLVRRE